MSVLAIYAADGGAPSSVCHDAAMIADELAKIGVQFERWQTEQPLPDNATPLDILSAYQASVDRLKQHYGFQSADVIAMQPEHPDRVPLRAKFRAEHIHSDFEVRFFVAGCGLFFLHPNDSAVYGLLCEAGDLISVPANVAHWFDMGEAPDFQCIRLFTTAEGWVAQFTGSDIAARFPNLMNFRAQYA